jgi:hypothetical protein
VPTKDQRLAQDQLEGVDSDVRVKNPAYINDKDEVVIPFAGKEFRVRKSISPLALGQFMRFSSASTQDSRTLSSLVDLLKSCITKEDWPDFWDAALEAEYDTQEEEMSALVDVVQAALESVSGRPTKQRGSSSNTSGTTTRASKAKSSPRAATSKD